jgi:ectoine hydroxylase-related dioxygenase (phytanoyl-CoA dioxygenase family)
VTRYLDDDVDAAMKAAMEAGMDSDPSHALEQRGFARLGQQFSASEVARLCEHSERHAAERVTAGAYGAICHNPWRDLPVLARAIEEILAPRALALLDAPELILFQDISISKPPGAAAVAWHQDYSYWPLDHAAGITLWVAFDDAAPDNGCLRYIPGTHHLGERHPADFFEGAAQPRRPHLAPLDPQAYASSVVDAPVRAGAVLAHHPLVWHMSFANQSRRPRRAWSITFVTPDARWHLEHAPHPFAYQLQPTSGAALLGEHFPRFRRAK